MEEEFEMVDPAEAIEGLRLCARAGCEAPAEFVLILAELRLSDSHQMVLTSCREHATEEELSVALAGALDVFRKKHEDLDELIRLSVPDAELM